MKYTISIDVEMPRNMDSGGMQVATALTAELLDGIPEGVRITNVMVYEAGDLD